MDQFLKVYSKKRKNFGRQPIFSRVGPHMLDSISPDKNEQNDYGLRNPVHQESLATTFQKEHLINTIIVDYKEHGVNHAEGGWPKDIPFSDEDATSRHRRRFERDDAYVDAVLHSYKKLFHFMEQNNAINMYEMYFTNMKPVEPVENPTVSVTNVFPDKGSRPVASLNWTHEDDPKLVVAYCNKKVPLTRPVKSDLLCAVWSIEDPHEPSFEFLPPSACWQAICSPVDPSIVLGGLEDGRVCVFDIRKHEKHVLISPTHLAHRDPVSAMIYMKSRQDVEFFSGSLDGCCKWWDIRNLSNPTDVLIMTVREKFGQDDSLSNADGVNILQYDKAFPTRFMCGTDTGMVMKVNRKGKTRIEMMCALFKAHLGPVKALNISPCTSKIFITCGDWTVHVWNEEIMTSPIVTGMPHQYQVNDVSWSPSRLSGYMSVSADGKFRYWDLLRKYHKPRVTLLISKNPLLKMIPHIQGRVVAVGDIKGKVFTMSLSDSLVVSGDNDKQLMMQTFERETRRESILEARVKEIRLKLATENIDAPIEDRDDEALIKDAEEAYMLAVNEEARRTVATSSNSQNIGKMRNR